MTDESTKTVSRRAEASALVIALGLPTLATWVHCVLLADCGAGTKQIAYSAGKVVPFAFLLVWVLAIERRRICLRRPNCRGLPEAVVFGVLVLVGMLVGYYGWLGPAGHLDAAGLVVRGELNRAGVDTPAKYMGFGAFIIVLHSLWEECYWRWYVFGGLRRMVSLGRYFEGLSLATVGFSLAVAVGGGVWAWIYDRSESLYGPWLSHLLVDAGIFVVGYQMVGGQFGP